jgi:sugar-phosphatase
MPAACLLDLDGTLLDTEPIHVRAHAAFLATVGIRVPDAVLYGNIGKGDAAFYRRLMAEHGVAGEVESWFAGKTAEMRRLLTAAPTPHRPGARALVDAAHAAGATPMVVTSSDRDTVAIALRSAGLAERLPLRVTADDVVRRKPDPEPYRLACARLGVPPGACWAVEDSEAGVASARAAGIGRVVAVPDHVPAPALLAAGAHRCAPDLHTVAGWL